MRGVMEEKQGRVVEVIVSSVKPFELMFGKIVGIGLVGLTQFLIWAVLIFAIMIFVQPLLMSTMDPAMLQQGMDMAGQNLEELEYMNELVHTVYYGINWGMLLVMFVIYFIGGYLLYGSLFAIVGAAAESEADTQQLD